MTYNWQISTWPDFVYNVSDIQPIILELAEETGEVNGMVTSLSDDLKEETSLQLMLSEAVKTSEIEGEFVSREDVMSSLRNNLGLNDHPVYIKDRHAGGVAQLMVAARKSFNEPLHLDMLLEWHKILMVNAKHINTGQWRTGTQPMQVISGTHGREVVHFEAPPSSSVLREMEGFIHWYNNAIFPLKTKIAEAVLKAAIAHLYFESIHPFEDGNGRIGRAIAEKALSQSLGRPVMLSLSNIIERDKVTYYSALKEAQRTLEITGWINYFAGVILDAQRDAKMMVQFTLQKARFFDLYKDQFNKRQLKAINKMMEKGTEGFQGGMTAKKYININKTSKATATRDLQQLQIMGVLTQEGAGRSVRYHLNLR
jgi:Fic family protein